MHVPALYPKARAHGSTEILAKLNQSVPRNRTRMTVQKGRPPRMKMQERLARIGGSSEFDNGKDPSGRAATPQHVPYRFARPERRCRSSRGGTKISDQIAQAVKIQHFAVSPTNSIPRTQTSTPSPQGGVCNLEMTIRSDPGQTRKSHCSGNSLDAESFSSCLRRLSAQDSSSQVLQGARISVRTSSKSSGGANADAKLHNMRQVVPSGG